MQVSNSIYYAMPIATGKTLSFSGKKQNGTMANQKPGLFTRIFTASFPWKKGRMYNGQVKEFHALASVLPLNSYKDIPRFLLWTLRIRRQLAHTPGMVGYRLKAELPIKRFWTLSVWDSQEHMEAFVHSGFHQDMLKDMKGRLGRSKFKTFAVTKKELPLTWAVAEKQLDMQA